MDSRDETSLKLKAFIVSFKNKKVIIMLMFVTNHNKVKNINLCAASMDQLF